jgi:hypothetical protein
MADCNAEFSALPKLAASPGADGVGAAGGVIRIIGMLVIGAVI